MKPGLILLVFCLWLAGCAQAPIAPRAEQLFHDELFGAPTETIRADDVFALSDGMKRYLGTEIAAQLRRRGPRDGLVEALYSRSQLKLEYDSVMTRNAAQAFDARSGNCLSLVIMTAAFARHLGLPVRYQSVFVDESWIRNGDLQFVSSHVNLTLSRGMGGSGGYDTGSLMTIDFLPAEEIRGARTREIGESTIVAMFMNNRAAEALAAGRIADAYWWAKHAIGHEPTFLSAYNTLGVVYLRRNEPALAREVFERVLEREPRNTRSLANLVRVLQVQGRDAEARAASERLAQIEPYAPFHFFDRGVAAMRAGDFRAAKELFTKEIERDAYYHEFQFWLALAHYGLGDLTQARKHLDLARETSTTRQDRELYAAKLDRIKGLRAQ